MAVLQGARLRTGALPATRSAPARSAPAREPATAALSAAPRVRPMGLLMAAIVIATMLALAYLTQTLGSNATSTEVRIHQAKQAEMMEEIRRQASHVQIKADAVTVQKEARRLELKKLPKAVTLDAP